MAITGVMNRWRGAVKASLLMLDHNVTGRVLDSVTGNNLRLLWTNAGVPTNGAAGTLFGKALAGDLLLDTTNKVLYQNTNTSASPTWTALTTATGAGTYTGTFDGVVGGSAPALGTFTFIDASAGITLTAVGNNRATSLALTKAINVISTAAASTGVTLPASASVGVGGWVDIYNDGANAIQVYGAGTDTIDTVAAATGVPLTNAKRCRYTLVSTGAFKSAQLGVVSA